MLSLEPEIESLRPLLGDRLTGVLVARERRVIFSIYPEIRFMAWAGALLLATAAGIVLKNNLDRVGPLALAMLMGAAAAVCYAWVWWRRERGSIVDDYVLLLGALLVSADAGFIESQFHLLGQVWYRQFLIVAVWHGVGAYLYGSRMLLSLSVTALAAWLGVEWQPMDAFGKDPTMLAMRAFGCSGVVAVWWVVNRRPAFRPVLEHFTAIFALVGGLTLMFESETRVLGCLATLVVAGAVIFWGFHTRREPFVLYGFVCAVIAADVLVIDVMDLRDEAVVMLLLVVSSIAAIIALIAIHSRFSSLTPKEVTPKGVKA